MRVFFGLIILMFSFLSSSAQIITDYARLKRFSKIHYKSYAIQKNRAINILNKQKRPVKVLTDSTVLEVQFIDRHGIPQYFITHNANAAKTISTDKVYLGGGAGLSLDGSGVTLREWDAGVIRTSHVEFGGRVVNVDNAAVSGHSTHVAGTMIASGVDTAAKGMAPAATLRSFDWNYMDAEMADEAASGCLISNHSYGWVRGWNGSAWYGDTTVSKLEDYKFGFYDETSRNLDEIAYYAPYYLIVKSSGNDRDDYGNGTYPPDGPYDCIEQLGVAKNILTVGAVYDMVNGYTQASDVQMTNFSSWGPADDGRIKPDIVANGTSLYSTYSTSDDAYAFMTGTSMSSPSVAGSLALLVQQYAETNGQDAKMRSATLKALVINTADEAGSFEGPDYSFGWGLMNTKKAALKIRENDSLDVILEKVLNDGAVYEKYFRVADTQAIRVTLVWTDPPGKIPAQNIVDPDDPAIINDLDLTVEDTLTHQVYYPWKLDKDNPSDSAVQGVNDVDNVEQVDIAKADSGHVYHIKITHKGSLQNGRQAFSLVISASVEKSDKLLPDFYASNLSVAKGQKVYFFDASEGKPDTWSWSFTPAGVNYLDGTDSTSVNPVVEFSEPGSYEVALKITNSTGDTTVSKANYITVGDDPTGYCEAYSLNFWGYISRVVLGDIDHSSTYSNAGDAAPNQKYYQDWTSVSTELVRGQRRKITIDCSETSAVYAPYFDKFVWVDWNRDGDFYDDGELVVRSIDDSTSSFYFSIPDSAALGNTRMRIRIHYYNDYIDKACSYSEYGEVEDYTVTIVDPEPVVWTGNVSTDWYDAGNWDTGKVPDFKNDVRIPASLSSGNFPQTTDTSAIELNSLNLENGVTVTLKGTVKIYGEQ